MISGDRKSRCRMIIETHSLSGDHTLPPTGASETESLPRRMCMTGWLIGLATLASTTAAAAPVLRPFGVMALFGQSSGRVEPIDPNLLQRGSLFLTRSTLATHAADRGWFKSGAKELVEMVRSGRVKVAVNHMVPLEDAALAHQNLEGRLTTGSTILETRHADSAEAAADAQIPKNDN